MRYYKLPYIIYRDYPDFGYLTDNRNFGYDTASKSCLKVGDRVLSKIGSVFYSILGDAPQSTDDLARKLLPLFVGTTLDEIEDDAEAFYCELAEDGFIGRGEAVSENCCFSYEDFTPRFLADESLEDESGVDVMEKWGSEYHLTRVHLEVSGRCNERCSHCYFPDSYRRGTMSYELFHRILIQCKDANVLSITISGGEPMLNPDLLLFIDECKNNNFSINLLSNLTLITGEMVDVFSRTPLFSIQTSLYSMDAAVHDSITKVPGSFEKTKEAIEECHRHNIPMQINCPIMKQNRESYQSVLDWAKTLNIEASSDYLLFGCFDGSGKNLSSRLDLTELDSIIREEYNGKSWDSNHKPKSEHELAGHEYSICPVCLSSICISNSGEVYPCEGWQSCTLGNLNNSTLMQIWENSKEVQALREYSYDDFPKCKSCPDKDFCSICLLRNANESPSGSHLDINPYFCKVAQLKRKIARQSM